MRRSSVTLALLGVLGCEGGSADGGAPGAGSPAQAERGQFPQRRRPLAPELREVTRAVEEQRFEDGQELAQRFVDSHPDDGQAHFLLGMTYYWTGNFGAARPWLERALELEPDIHVIHDSLGYALFMLGDLGGARREYEAFLAVAPGEPKGHYGVGLIELEETQLAEAEARFRRAIELFDGLQRSDPRQVATRLPELAECHARLGEVHFAGEDFEAARAELALATTICPGNISAFYTLSVVHRRLGEEELADQAAARYESARQAILARQRLERE